MTDTKVDIFVSGAGPVGLFFTYQMALRGHSVYCVDPEPSPTDQSRAILITSRTLEVLERRGLASDILSESYIASGMQIFRNGSKVKMSIVSC
jgi:2-polyprenyl-6-methoxyphenol hydroxylase-like FAD-dependent oxidoreductase